MVGGRDDVLLGVGMGWRWFIAAQVADEIGGNRLDRRHLSRQLGVLRFGKSRRKTTGPSVGKLHFQVIDLV